MENLGSKRVTGKIFETKELWKDANIALELCNGYRAGREARSRKIVEGNGIRGRTDLEKGRTGPRPA